MWEVPRRYHGHIGVYARLCAPLLQLPQGLSDQNVSTYHVGSPGAFAQAPSAFAQAPSTFAPAPSTFAPAPSAAPSDSFSVVFFGGGSGGNDGGVQSKAGSVKSSGPVVAEGQRDTGERDGVAVRRLARALRSRAGAMLGRMFAGRTWSETSVCSGGAAADLGLQTARHACSPTGRHAPLNRLHAALRCAPARAVRRATAQAVWCAAAGAVWRAAAALRPQPELQAEPAERHAQHRARRPHASPQRRAW
jgi:hypothetical protein